MTRRELSQYYWLRREIEYDERRLAALRSRAENAGPNLTGMPRGGGGAGDRLGELAAEITDLETLIEEKRARCVRECARIEEFIQTIPDSMIRLVFAFRCVERMTWRQVAAAMSDRTGYRMSEIGARQTFYRYLKARGKADWRKL